MTPYKERLEKSSYAALVNIPCQDAQAVKHLALSMIGAGYDYLWLLGIFLHSDGFDNKARFFCSEFVAWAFEKAGSPLIRPEITGRVTPQHLWMLPAPTVTAGTPLSLLNLA